MSGLCMDFPKGLSLPRGLCLILLLLPSFCASRSLRDVVTPVENDDVTEPDPVPSFLNFRNVQDYPLEDQIALLTDFQDSEVTPGFFEGDMAGVDVYIQNLVRIAYKWDVFPQRRWPNATVHYVISKKYKSDEKKVIQTAIDTLDFMTCIKFLPWDRKAKDYIFIYPVKKPAGCWSYVGRRGGQQVLSLQPPDRRSRRCFGAVGKPIHELMHALGIFHEQSRPDRDKYVDVRLENIIPRFVHNFAKKSPSNATYYYEYDYDSVMHYGSHFFTKKKGKPTIVPKDKTVKIGQRSMLSVTDCLKVNQVYNCFEGDPFQALKYKAFCTYLGIGKKGSPLQERTLNRV